MVSFYQPKETQQQRLSGFAAQLKLNRKHASMATRNVTCGRKSNGDVVEATR